MHPLRRSPPTTSSQSDIEQVPPAFGLGQIRILNKFLNTKTQSSINLSARHPKKEISFFPIMLRRALPSQYSHLPGASTDFSSPNPGLCVFIGLNPGITQKPPHRDTAITRTPRPLRETLSPLASLSPPAPIEDGTLGGGVAEKYGLGHEYRQQADE